METTPIHQETQGPEDNVATVDLLNLRKRSHRLGLSAKRSVKIGEQEESLLIQIPPCGDGTFTDPRSHGKESQPLVVSKAKIEITRLHTASCPGDGRSSWKIFVSAGAPLLFERSMEHDFDEEKCCRLATERDSLDLGRLGASSCFLKLWFVPSVTSVLLDTIAPLETPKKWRANDIVFTPQPVPRPLRLDVLIRENKCDTVFVPVTNTLVKNTFLDDIDPPNNDATVSRPRSCPPKVFASALTLEVAVASACSTTHCRTIRRGDSDPTDVYGARRRLFGA